MILLKCDLENKFSEHFLISARQTTVIWCASQINNYQTAFMVYFIRHPNLDITRCGADTITYVNNKTRCDVLLQGVWQPWFISISNRQTAQNQARFIKTTPVCFNTLTCLLSPSFSYKCWLSVVFYRVHRPFARYVKLLVVHAPGVPGTFPRHRGLAIPTSISARASRTCRDACRNR